MGYIIALFSACASSARDLVSKSLASRVDPDLSTFASFLFALPFYAALLGVAFFLQGGGVSVSWLFVGLVALRGISDLCAEGFKMRALAHGDVSLVTGLLSLSPLILTLLSPLITGDTVRGFEVIGLGIIVLGGSLLIRRDRSTGRVFQPRAIVYALGASVAFALNTCFDRLAVTHAGPIESAFAMTVCAAVLASPVSFLGNGAAKRESLATHHRSFLLRGLFETAFMVTKMWALVSLPGHVVMGLTRFSMILTVVVGGTLFHERDRLRRILGVAIMYVGLLTLLGWVPFAGH